MGISIECNKKVVLECQNTIFGWLHEQILDLAKKCDRCKIDEQIIFMFDKMDQSKYGFGSIDIDIADFIKTSQGIAFFSELVRTALEQEECGNVRIDLAARFCLWAFYYELVKCRQEITNDDDADSELVTLYYRRIIRVNVLTESKTFLERFLGKINDFLSKQSNVLFFDSSEFFGEVRFEIRSGTQQIEVLKEIKSKHQALLFAESIKKLIDAIKNSEMVLSPSEQATLWILYYRIMMYAAGLS